MRVGFSITTLLVLFATASVSALDTVTRIDDERIVGTVTHVDSSAMVTVEIGRRIVRVRASEVLFVRFGVKKPAGRAPDADLIVLASGERYWVKLLPGVKAKLVCTGAKSLDGKTAVPFADLRAWVPTRRDVKLSGDAEELPDVVRELAMPRDPETILDELLALKNNRDVVTLWSGDRMTGIVESIGPTQVVVSAKVGRVAVKRAKIRGIAFSKTFKPWREPEGILAEARLADGSVVLGKIRGSTRGGYALESVLGPTWKVKARDVRKVEFRGGKLVWLSDLEPSETRTSGFFNRTWGPRMNRSVWGRPLTVAGTVYAHGIGCHARTDLRYNIDGKYVTFVTMIGIDDETKGAGSVLFSVIGDGRILLGPVEISGGRKPKRVKLSVRDVNVLTVKVDFGKDQDFGDHLDLLDARLIKK